MTPRTLNRTLLAGLAPAFAAAAAVILTDRPARIPAMAVFLGYLALTAAASICAEHPGAGRRLLHTARTVGRAAAILATPPLTVQTMIRALTRRPAPVDGGDSLDGPQHCQSRGPFAGASHAAATPAPELTHHATIRHSAADTDCGTRRFREPMTRAWKDVTCPDCIATLDQPANHPTAA